MAILNTTSLQETPSPALTRYFSMDAKPSHTQSLRLYAEFEYAYASSISEQNILNCAHVLVFLASSATFGSTPISLDYL